MPRNWSTALKASSPCRSHVVLAAGRAPDRQLLTLVDVPVTSPSTLGDCFSQKFLSCPDADHGALGQATVRW